MRCTTKYALALIIVAVVAGGAIAQDGQDLAPLLQQLGSDDAGARMAAVSSLAEAGPQAVALLFDFMATADPATNLAARLAVQRIVQHAASPSGAAQRNAVARDLKKQALADRPVAVRTFAVRMLSFVAGDDSVPALADLLQDPHMAEIARWALVRIPGRASVEALAAAMPGAQGELKIGLINALGARRETSALPALEAALKADDPAVRAAAIAAIGRLPGARPETLLRALIASGAEAEKAAAWDAYVRWAENALADGRGTRAYEAYRWVYENAPTEQLRCAGLIGLGNAGVDLGMPLLFAALDDPQRNVRGAAVEALVAVPVAAATVVIANRMIDVDGANKQLLIEILGRRRDPTAIKQLAAAGTDADEAVRAAATSALGEMGDAAAVPHLVGRLRDNSEQVRDAAFLSLVRVRGDKATQAEIAAAGGRAPEAVRAALMRALGNRQDAAAIPTLLDALTDGSRAVRLAALEGLAVSARLTDAAARARLVEALCSGDDEERRAAEYALSRMPASMITADDVGRMLQAGGSAPVPAQAALVRVMAQWDNPDLLSFLLDATKDNNPEVVVAALGGVRRLLAPETFARTGSSPQDIEAELLAIAEKGTPAVKSAAIEAYLVLADQRRESDAAAAAGAPAALEMYHRALTTAADDDNHKAALRGIAAIGSVESLPLVEPLLEGGPVAGEAAAAVMPIAAKVAQAGNKDQAVELYRKAIRASSDRDLLRAAVERLRELGVEMDVPAEAGFVTQWWVLGPFDGARKMATLDAIPTDAPVDLGAAVVVEGKSYNWKHAQISDPAGMLDLREAVAPQEDCAAYAYAEVTSETARDVVFKIGSDDAVVCRLNGEHIHTYADERGWAPDQDIVPARLRAGTNFILLKVINGGADWACSLRITDTDNVPLHLDQRKP